MSRIPELRLSASARSDRCWRCWWHRIAIDDGDARAAMHPRARNYRCATPVAAVVADAAAAFRRCWIAGSPQTLRVVRPLRPLSEGMLEGYWMQAKRCATCRRTKSI